ncbi:amidase signature enzyme [Dissoconium aciculare CBS 342.82]|uniref:Amidase signature enzyme n=1 Tax=Dissoconium aciculare CBS 342.82 TaxID=1314786 RepID=A0A6J3MA85_9PEZI|nr:amidase signature enzyme [Dissoconium aciculare CBS 342.82]KAF1823727.1 amidase signature enzyme [Dissoconium aciculare CBS 342.82]
MAITTAELPSARPYAYRFPIESTALIIIDMQRDFLDPNGFGMIQCGNDEVFAKVREVVPRTRAALHAARSLGLHVVHTREGHTPDLADLPPSKRFRQVSAPAGHHTIGIGEQGPMGRLLVRGEYGHDIVDELRPVPGELVIDKPGKGSMWRTSLHRSLLAHGITHLLFAGVTTECCVNTTAREAADRGFECCVLADCTAGFDPGFYESTLDVLCAYDGLFGFVGSSQELLKIANDAQGPSTQATGDTQQLDLSIKCLRTRYTQGSLIPEQVVTEVSRRIAEYHEKNPAVWTYLRSGDELSSSARELNDRFSGKPLPPLYGIPFAVKDNIDVTGIPTTAACEAFTRTPTATASVVQAILDAGGIFIGKTNLDQLATGLSGCRSPFGTPKSVFGDSRVAGGSSSGSAVAVGANLVSFALGTDTAGSGRVPAAFNGVVGFKPTKGTVSTQGVVPACKSLDTVSILASSVTSAREVWLVCDTGPDSADAYAKPQQSLSLWHADFRGPKVGGFVFGVPPQKALEICEDDYRILFLQTSERLQRAGGTPFEVDWTLFENSSNLLYNASFVLERVACLGSEFLTKHLQSLHPATRTVFGAALESNIKPWQVFEDLHLQAEYIRQTALVFQHIDVLLVPTTPCHPTIQQIEADPIVLNSKIGYYSHFANVLDLCGLAVPASTFHTTNGEELPFGITLLGASGTDGKIFDIAREFERTT